MTVRKTESRIPTNFQAADLGEAVVAADGRCALVSFITSPLAVDRENVYVVFVTDAALAAAAQSFEWMFSEDGSGTTTQTTARGELSYSPRSTGGLRTLVRILGAGDAEQARIEMVQDVGPLNAELEELITAASTEPGPGVSNPDVARELINDHNPYYKAVTLQTPETQDGFQRMLFGMVFGGSLQRTSTERKQQIDKLSESLNSQTNNFAAVAAQGVGVCAIRLPLLAMTLPQSPANPTPMLNWTELPEVSSKRDLADEQLRETLAALDETARIDLFNLTRFPKSNITRCARILEALRDRYFSGTSFDDVLTGMSGTRAHWIMRHYQEGPLLRN